MYISNLVTIGQIDKFKFEFAISLSQDRKVHCNFTNRFHNCNLRGENRDHIKARANSTMGIQTVRADLCNKNFLTQALMVTA